MVELPGWGEEEEEGEGGAVQLFLLRQWVGGTGRTAAALLALMPGWVGRERVLPPLAFCRH